MRYNHYTNKHNDTRDDAQSPFVACLMCEEDDYRCLGLYSAMDDDTEDECLPAIVLCANCRQTLRGDDFLGKLW